MRRKIVLHSVRGEVDALDEMVKGWIAENVEAICIVGRDSDKIHFQIDMMLSDHELSSRDADHIETTSHDDETLDEVIAFARETYSEGEPVVVEV
jgi:hypothetical protein